MGTDNSESPSQWYRNFGSSDHNQQEESTYTYNFVHAHVLVSNFSYSSHTLQLKIFDELSE